MNKHSPFLVPKLRSAFVRSTQLTEMFRNDWMYVGDGAHYIGGMKRERENTETTGFDGRIYCIWVESVIKNHRHNERW
jgi:hypothetical protein